MDEPAKHPVTASYRRRSVQFHPTVQVYADAHEHTESADRWYAKKEILMFLRNSRDEVTKTLAAHRTSRRRMQQAYVLYSEGLDTSTSATEDDMQACQAVGLDRLVVHAHLRRHKNERRRKLLRRMDELQDIPCPLRRERLLAQASHGISDSAVFAAAHLAQWWSTNKNAVLQ